MSLIAALLSLFSAIAGLFTRLFVPVPTSLVLNFSKGQSMPSLTTFAADGSLLGSLQVLDHAGRPIAAPPPPAWKIDNGSVATLAPSEDGLSATLTGLTAGTVTITVSLGTLTTSVTLTVTPATPGSLVLTFGPTA